MTFLIPPSINWFFPYKESHRFKSVAPQGFFRNFYIYILKRHQKEIHFVIIIIDEEIYIFIICCNNCCGGSSEGNSVQDTGAITLNHQQPAIISDTASTEMKTKINPRILIQNLFLIKIVFLVLNGQSFELIEMDKSCINNSSFNQILIFLLMQKLTLKIFLKSFDEITRDDIFNIQKPTIDEN